MLLFAFVRSLLTLFSLALLRRFKTVNAASAAASSSSSSEEEEEEEEEEEGKEEEEEEEEEEEGNEDGSGGLEDGPNEEGSDVLVGILNEGGGDCLVDTDVEDEDEEDDEEGDDGDGGVAVPGDQNEAGAAADAVPLPAGVAGELTEAAKKAFELVDKQNETAKDFTAVFQEISGTVRETFPDWSEAEKSKTPICAALAEGLDSQARAAYFEQIPRAEKGATLTAEEKLKRRNKASAIQRVGGLWKKLAFVIFKKRNVSLVKNKNSEPAHGTSAHTLRGVTPKKKRDKATGEWQQWVYKLRLLKAPATVEAAAAAAAATVAAAAVGGVGAEAGAVAPVTEEDRERAALAAARAERISLHAEASALGGAPAFDPEETPEYMYYIGITSDPPKRMDVHYREQEDGGVDGGGVEGGSDDVGGGGDTYFTSLHPVDRSYKPQFFQVYTGINGRFLEDAVVKNTMAEPGVGPKRVRGGTYTARNLSENSLDVIAQETRHAQELCLNCGAEGHMVSACSAPRRVQNTARDLGEAKSTLTSIVGALRELEAGSMDQDGVLAVMNENAAALQRLGV